jgi:hypothetical protein
MWGCARAWLRTARVLAAGAPAGGGRRPPADGRRADTPAGGRQADTFAGGGRRTGGHPGGRYTIEGHACMLALWEREDTEGGPSGRQGRRI